MMELRESVEDANDDDSLKEIQFQVWEYIQMTCYYSMLNTLKINKGYLVADWEQVQEFIKCISASIREKRLWGCYFCNTENEILWPSTWRDSKETLTWALIWNLMLDKTSQATLDCYWHWEFPFYYPCISRIDHFPVVFLIFCSTWLNSMITTVEKPQFFVLWF